MIFKIFLILILNLKDSFKISLNMGFLIFKNLINLTKNVFLVKTIVLSKKIKKIYNLNYLEPIALPSPGM